MNPASNCRNDYIDHALRLGYRLQGLPFADWKDKVVSACQGNPSIGIYPLAPLCAEYTAPESYAMPRYECGNVLQGLEGSGIKCAKIDAGLLDLYFECLIRIGAFPKPDSPGIDPNLSGPESLNEPAGKYR
jgi:hypothetical protein